MRIVRSYPLALAGATLAVALSVSAMSANAANTFLLQFGQHETEQAARSQWASLQQAHPDLLGDKQLRVAPVTTASGSETFRTQASGVADREEAQETCGALNAQNVTCLVVETSMYLPEEQLAAAEENVEVEMVSEEMDAVSVEGSAAPLEPMPALAEAGEETQEETGLFAGGFLPWLDNDDTPAEETVAIAETTAAPAAPPVPEQVIREPAAAAAAAAPQTEVTTAQAAAPVTQAAPTPQAAPAPQRVEPQAWPEQVDRSAAASMSEQLPQNKQLAPGETRVVASRAPRSLSAQLNNNVQSVDVPPAPQIAPQGVAGEAQVEVAEAIQVPLSFQESAAPVPVNRPVGYGGYPSQPQAKRSTWVQISHFSSKESAMAYWRDLSVRQPEMMRLMRVRIISPLSAGYNRQPKTSLRIGPFNDRMDVNTLCGAAAQQNLRCTMVQEVGSSTAARQVRQRPNPAMRSSRRAAVSRGYSSIPGAPASGMFWVQLGAFDTVGAAQQRWSQLHTVHGDVLGRMQPQVSYPALSSSPTPVYHLRTGPFVNSSSAAGLCNKLMARHLGCVVVQAR